MNTISYLEQFILSFFLSERGAFGRKGGKLTSFLTRRMGLNCNYLPPVQNIANLSDFVSC